MLFELPAVSARSLCKTYRVFNRPLDRLLQFLFRSKQYGKAFDAVKDISFDLPRGQVLGLVGNNGAGKSTLLQLVCQTLQPTSGQLTVNGRVAALLELGAGFNPEFSGRENVFLNAAVLGLSMQEIEQRYDSIVEFSGVGEFIEQPVKTYSSGMYMRLAFSIATSVDPDILIIDEALSVGDGGFARKSFDRIMALRERGVTILFCSHSMYHIEAICDQAMWLEQGRMVMLDSPQRVTKAYTGQMTANAAVKTEPNQTPASVDMAISASSQPAQGQARFLSIEVSADGAPGRLLRLQAGRSSLCVKASFQFDPDLALPSVAFGIDTTSGVTVSSGSTLFDHVTPKLVGPGLAEVTLIFPNTFLMRGTYRLTMFLACERTLHMYDHALSCAELEVVHDGTEQGICFLPHSWNDEAVVDVPKAT
jgi:lipopolysaccharide transport system ATP-binding protein